VKKELRPVHDHVACDVCGRTILKGERTETFLSPDGRRHQVCDLCFVRATHHGWIRESTADDLPNLQARPEPRRSLLGRFRKRRDDAPVEAEADLAEQEAIHAEDGAEPGEHELQEAAAEADAQPAPARPRSRPRGPRHIRALPTTQDGKVERAFELFNGSEHQRTVAGLARTLGAASVAAVPDVDKPASVTVVVAWELSWYRYMIDLGDDNDPVALVENGEEIDQIDQTLREWNATLDAEGRLVAGHAIAGGGTAER
jgi:hypothetical protein